MITALLIIFVAAISFVLGIKVAMIRTTRIMDEVRAYNEAYLNGDLPPTTEEEVLELGWFKNALTYDCPDEHAVSGKLCNVGGMWVCLARLKYAEEMEAPLYDVELGTDEYLPQDMDGGVWLEVEIQNDCGYGCKIYEHNKTGRRALAHNSAYGCTRTFNLNKE